MIGLFATLNLGARALQAQETGVEIAGQNLANINNPAYARQRVNLQTSIAIDTAVGPQGTGVDVTGIQQLRDALLDDQVRDEASLSSFWEAQQSGLESTQTALDEFLDQNASGVNGTADAGSASSGQSLSAQLTQLFNNFQSVATNPTSASERQTLVSQAQTLAGSFNQASARLSAVGSRLDTSITNDTASANQLLAQIADLNKQISLAEMPGGGMANDLRDLREQKLESLAQLGDFKATAAADGTVTVSVGSQTFVNGSQVVSQLATQQSGGKLVVYSTADAAPVPFTSGSIQGAMSLRDGALADLRNGLDSLASQLITQVNSIYSAGYDLHGNTGASFFTGANAGDIAVNSALNTDPALVQAAGAPGAAGDSSVALALGRLGSQPSAALGNQTFNDAYNQLVVNLGNSLANANDQVANQAAVTSQLMTQRNSVSGVSMEEEMANLMAFQRAYEASARIVSTVDQMLQTLINLKQ